MESDRQLKFFTEEVLTRESILATLKHHGDAMKYIVKQQTIGDKEINLAAIRQNGTALKYIKEITSEESQ